MQLQTMVAVVDKAIEVVGRGWCQNYSAVNGDGALVEAENPDAVAWCLLGSLYRGYHELYGSLDTYELQPLHERFDATVTRFTDGDYGSVTRWNDSQFREVEDVVELMTTVRDELAA